MTDSSLLLLRPDWDYGGRPVQTSGSWAQRFVRISVPLEESQILDVRYRFREGDPILYGEDFLLVERNFGMIQSVYLSSPYPVEKLRPGMFLSSGVFERKVHHDPRNGTDHRFYSVNYRVLPTSGGGPVTVNEVGVFPVTVRDEGLEGYLERMYR